MKGRGLLGWLKTGIESLVDPEKQERISRITKQLHQRIGADRNEFDLKSFVADKELLSDDLAVATSQVYSDYVRKFWDDSELTEKESKTLRWLSQALDLSPPTVAKLNQEVGLRVFSELLAKAMDSGAVTSETETKLHIVSQWLQSDIRQMMRHYFSREGDGFVRAIFAKCVEDGELVDDEWDHFMTTTQRLGLSKAEATNLISTQSKQFIEHVLSDAKSDESLTASEEATLSKLLSWFDLPSDFRAYVKSEVSRLKAITDIGLGRLPSLTPPKHIAIRSGEIVRFFGILTLWQTHQSKVGSTDKFFRGELIITDNRLIFTCPEKPFDINLRSVISVSRTETGIQLVAKKAVSGLYQFHDEAGLGARILDAAIRKANQTLVEQSTGTIDRHIPRDVRQRVWQRYSGKCVDCGDNQYLEYDHIIPVSRGGSNHDNNIQLLCRRCNLKKSDNI